MEPQQAPHVAAVGLEGVEPRDALREAFEGHYASLSALGLLLTGSRAAGEDLAQEAFVRAAARIAAVHPEARGAYLRQTVLNLWRNGLRRMALDYRLGAMPVPRESEPAIEERDEVWRLVRALPPRQRACLVLRYWADMDEREIARSLHCSVGTVKSQISRGLGRLRKEVGRVDR